MLFILSRGRFVIRFFTFALCLIFAACLISLTNSSTAFAQTKTKSPDTKKLTAKKLFATDRITNIDIELPKADWDEIRVQGRVFSEALSKELTEKPYTYAKGNITIDGVLIENVGIRKKGFLGSLNSERPSLKVKFSEYEKQSPVKGLDRLTLNNNNQDAGRICQYLAFKLFRDSGTHASRCGFAKVTVNGKYLGIYSNVEAIKSNFLEHSFGETKGAVYEGTVTDFYPEYVEKFEPKNKAAKKAEHIKKVTDILESAKIDLEKLDEVVDVDSFIKFWAMESLIGFWDGYCSNQNNYYIYRDSKTKKFHFMPWGPDSAFTDSSPIPPYFIRPRSVHAKAILPNKLYRNDKVKADYKATMMSFLEMHWNEEKLIAEVDRLEELLKPHVLPDNEKQFKRSLIGYRSFIKGRRKDIVGEFKSGPPKLLATSKPPIYFAAIGEIEATFKATYYDKAPHNPQDVGEVNLDLKVNGKELVLKDIGVYAQEDDRDPNNATILITGTSTKTGKKIIIAAGVPKTSFQPSKVPVTTGGAMIQPGMLGMIGMKMKMMFGNVQLDEASLKAGDKVEGKILMTIGDFRTKK